MHRLDPKKVGLTVGTFAALVHLVWSVIVAIGWGQALLTFVVTLHMIIPAATVGPFGFGMAAALVILAGIVGYAAGFVFATIWNKVHTK